MITILDNLIVIFLNPSLRKYGGDSQGYILITCATAFFAGGAYGCMDAALCEEAFLNG